MVFLLLLNSASNMPIYLMCLALVGVQIIRTSAFVSTNRFASSMKATYSMKAVSENAQKNHDLLFSSRRSFIYTNIPGIAFAALFPFQSNAEMDEENAIFPTVSEVGEEESLQSAARNTESVSEETVQTIVYEENPPDESSDLVEVYFGCGSFFHVQHIFVQAERDILGRSDLELTARTGYAGGKAGSKDGKVCYRNSASISDFRSLGHAEVVSVKIPKKHYFDFATVYFKLFNRIGDREDQFVEEGEELRNLVGFPGGVTSEYFVSRLVAAAKESGERFGLSRGQGDDPDTRARAFVMDSVEFPFFIAEKYNQFHDGNDYGENYPFNYNNLAGLLDKERVLGRSECPNYEPESKFDLEELNLL